VNGCTHIIFKSMTARPYNREISSDKRFKGVHMDDKTLENELKALAKKRPDL
jgi:hypothetical protein